MSETRQWVEPTSPGRKDSPGLKGCHVSPFFSSAIVFALPSFPVCFGCYMMFFCLSCFLYLFSMFVCVVLMVFLVVWFVSVALLICLSCFLYAVFYVCSRCNDGISCRVAFVHVCLAIYLHHLFGTV